MRLVHWYQWQNKEFCDDRSGKLIVNVAEMSSRTTTTFSSSNGMLIALSITITMFVVLVVIGIVLTRIVTMKKRRVNRRF